MTAAARPPRSVYVAVAVVVAAGGCTQGPVQEVERVLHRQNCLVCHRPLDAAGDPAGIEEAHPWEPMSCTDCHGGAPWVCDGPMGGDPAHPTCDGEWVYDMERAHVRSPGGPQFLRSLSAGELDEVDPAWLRFVNPGDLRVADRTCGPCHEGIVERVRRSSMAHGAGEVTMARYRAGAQPDPVSLYGVVDVEGEAGSCAVERIERFEPTRPGAGEVPTMVHALDAWIAGSCFGCHLNSFGDNRFAGSMRSSGCTACHMTYADDGHSDSADPRINKHDSPHPVRHELTASPPTEQCAHCHHGGARIAMSYRGWREAAGAGMNPPAPEALGRPLHGAGLYFTDEDTTNDFDETPPDVHFEAGMHCVDCHTEREVHGDGRLHADGSCGGEVRCQSCHGSARKRAVAGAFGLFKVGDSLRLRTRVTGVELEAPQVLDAITPGHPRFSEAAAEGMGVDASGFSHTDRLECDTCHSGWLPSCYGCHVTVDFGKRGPSGVTGSPLAGVAHVRRLHVALNDLVLLRNERGLLAPSMPAEQLFVTVLDAAGKPTTPAPVPRASAAPGAPPGFGRRAVHPHTVRRRSPFMACDRCHSVEDPEAPTNEPLLRLTHGFGTDRFLLDVCDLVDGSCEAAPEDRTWRLDAVMDDRGDPRVSTHQLPAPSRPLTLDEVAAMRRVVVPAGRSLRTPIPTDALGDPWWPPALPMR